MKRSKWSIIFTLIGAIFFFIYLIWADPFEILFEAGRFNLYVFLIAVLLNYIGLFFLALSWHIILKILGVGINVWRSLQITFVSMFVVWLFPVPSGVEIIRAYLVKDEANSNLGKAVSSVIVNKVYYFIAFCVLIVSGAFMVTFVQGDVIPVDERYVWFVVIYALMNTVLFGVVMKPKTLIGLHEKSPDWVRENLFYRIYGHQRGLGGFKRFTDEVGKSLKDLRNSPGLNLVSLFLVAFHWSTGSVTAYMVAMSLGYRIDFWVIVLIYAVIEFIQQLNVVIPSGLGIVDAGLTGALVVVGVPLGASSAISLLTRLATYWFELVLCGIVSFHFGYREALKDFKFD